MIDTEWQIKIVDQLIRKDPDSTIKDFIEVLKEVDEVNSTMPLTKTIKIYNKSKDKT